MTVVCNQTPAIKLLAHELAKAERDGRKLQMEDIIAAGIVPETIEAGFAAQSAATKAIGKPVLGWKVAINSKGMAVAAPVLDVYFGETDGQVRIAKPYAEAVELEICFRLNGDILPPGPGQFYSREDIMRKIGSIHLGAELIGSRIAQHSNVPFPLFLADRLGNHSFVLGPEVGSELVDMLAAGEISNISLHLRDKYVEKFSGAPGHPQHDPAFPLVAFANNSNGLLGGMKSGQFVTTGSLCGVIPIRPEAKLFISGTGFPEMEILIVAKKNQTCPG